MTRASTFGYLLGGVFCTAIASMGAVDPCLAKGGSCSYVGFYKVLFGVLSMGGYVGAIMDSHQTEEEEFEEFREKQLSFQSRGAISELYAQKAVEVAEVMAEEYAMTAAGIPLELPPSIPQTQFQPVATTVQAVQSAESVQAVQSTGLIPSPANSLAMQNSIPTPMTLTVPTLASPIQAPIQVTLPDGAKLIEATALENIDEYPVVMVIAGMGSGKTQTMRWIFSRLSGTKVFSSHKAEIQDLKKFDLCFGYCPQTGQSRWIGDQNSTVTTLDRDLTWIKNTRDGIGTISEFYWGVYAEITNRQLLGSTKVQALETYRAFSDETSFAFSVAYNDPLNNDSLKWGQSLVAGSNKATFMDARSNRVQIYYAAQGEAVETIGLKNVTNPVLKNGACRPPDSSSGLRASCSDQTPRKRSRYLGHDTLECEASSSLCRCQLNSSKVTGTVLSAQQAQTTRSKLTLRANRRDATMSNQVLVLDTNKKPLTPCTPGIARSLLKAEKAAVFRRFPFTIILKKEVTATPEPIELKLDPGSKTTGIALVQGDQVLFGAELTHRGQAIKASLESRRALRRGRRSRHTRYRQARFLNRTRSEGWLAPSLQHRVETTLTWVSKFIRLAPIGSIVQELVRFDLQQLENPEISGIEYQQGELAGYEVREYLLNKWDRQCTYLQR